MKGNGKKSACEKCTKPYCHEEVVCPECNGQGFLGVVPLGEESDNDGLNSAAELPCPGCENRGTLTVYCPHYLDRLAFA